jgi:hypothetical protein
MKKSILILLLFSGIINGFCQDNPIASEKYTAHNKGKWFVFWGGNRDNYTKSDIRFTGKNYDFTIYDTPAHDVPKGWHIDYINPGRMTIPQNNFRLGYYFSDHYSISLGSDHMKYVMNQNVAVNLSGNYPNAGTFGEVLPNNQVLLTEDFLTFEHTDGLNYVHAELARIDDFSKVFNLPNTDKFQINATEGIGLGVLFPKTNTKLMGMTRHDEFHVSGFGISAKAGLNFTFYKHFFIQTELKAGYINMPDIRTTYDGSDSASQSFFFLEKTIALGGIFRL